jgi:hypothetical protein
MPADLGRTAVSEVSEKRTPLHPFGTLGLERFVRKKRFLSSYSTRLYFSVLSISDGSYCST